MKLNHTAAVIALVAASVAPSSAEYFLDKDPGTAGNQSGSVYVPRTAPFGNSATLSEGWEQLTATQYPDVDVFFPGADDWLDVALSHVGTNDGTSYLLKTADGAGGFGGPYPASGSIYFGGTSATTNLDGGELTVFTDSGNVLSGVKTVVFQLDIGEAWTYDVYAAPVLYYSLSGGGGGSVSATYQSLYKKLSEKSSPCGF